MFLQFTSVFEMAHKVLADTPPAGHHSPFLKQPNYLEQKRRGSMSLRAYPNYQALALPLDKDKQRKACPRHRIYIDTLRHNKP